MTARTGPQARVDVPLDPEIVQFRDRQQAQGFPSYVSVGPERAREVSAAVTRWRGSLGNAGDEVLSVEDVRVPGASSLRARVYRPVGDPVGQVLYFHGGGFVVGDLDTCEAHCRALAAQADVVVTSLDYSLAPEHPYPVAIDEGLRALRWVCGEDGPAGSRRTPLALAGDSAGANLATSVLLRVPDDPTIVVAAQLLLYPMLDPSMSFPSIEENAEGYMLDRSTLEWFWRLYLPRDVAAEAAAAAPLASPVDGMPATVVVTAGYDPLRDEGEAYARRLEAAGIPTTTLRYPSLVHGFFGWGAHVAAARSAVTEICAALRDTLAGGTRA